MPRSIFNIFLTCALVCACAMGCNKADLVIMYAKQQDNIDKYIESQKAADSTLVVVRNNGVYRIQRVAGSAADSLKAGQSVSLLYAAYKMTNASAPNASALFATNNEEIAKAARFNIDSTAFQILTLDFPGDLVDGLKYGLEGVREGGEYEVIFSGKYGLGNKILGNVPASSALLYKFWIKSVN